jgi:hypothetical protein
MNLTQSKVLYLLTVLKIMSRVGGKVQARSIGVTNSSLSFFLVRTVVQQLLFEFVGSIDDDDDDVVFFVVVSLLLCPFGLKRTLFS